MISLPSLRRTRMDLFLGALLIDSYVVFIVFWAKLLIDVPAHTFRIETLRRGRHAQTHFCDRICTRSGDIRSPAYRSFFQRPPFLSFARIDNAPPLPEPLALTDKPRAPSEPY